MKAGLIPNRCSYGDVHLYQVFTDLIYQPLDRRQTLYQIVCYGQHREPGSYSLNLHTGPPLNP